MNVKVQGYTEITVKWLSLLGAVVAALWSYHTYIEARERDFYSLFWSKKFELFLETSAAASTMATTTDLSEFNRARTKYLELYYGRLSLVEGEGVKHAMMDLKPNIPSGVVEQASLPFREMQDKAYKLTVELKKELGTAWQKPFSELPGTLP